MLNLNSRCSSIMWELKMSTRTSRMSLFVYGLIGEIFMLKWTKRIYFVRCVRKHYEFEWFLLSCKLLIEWLWTKVHCTWRLLEDIKITWPTNCRRYRKHSFRFLSSLVFRCCCKNRSDDGWKSRAKLHYLNWYIILPRNSNTGIKWKQYI